MTWDAERVKLGRIPVTVTELDLDGCGLAYGLGATNLLTYSEQFDHADWSKSNAAVTANTGTGADGTTTADTLADNSGAAYGTISQAVSGITGSQAHTVSVFIEKDSIGRLTRYPLIRLSYSGSASDECSIKVDTKTGEYAAAGSIIDALNVEDYNHKLWRVTMTATSTDSANNVITILIFPSVGSGLDWTGESVSVEASIGAWGAQLVQDSIAGHYVKTTSTSTSLTCTASLSAGSECYNTRNTCQDTANYTKIFKTIRLCQPRPGLPVGTIMFPCLADKVKYTPTQIKPDKGLSIRSTCEVAINDFAHHDRGLDPYFSTRTFDPMAQGSFLGRLLARNPHYVGRFMRVRDGFIVDGAWDWDSFQDRLFIIDNISGPDIRNGRVTYKVIGKDILKLGEAKRTKVPEPTDGKLDAALTAGATSLTLTATTTLTDYPTGGGTVMIRKEIMTYTSRSGQTVSGLVRGQYGTTATAQSAGDTVQLCKELNANIIDVIDDVLENHIGIDGDIYIPYDAGLTTPTGTNDEWDDEQDNWLNVTINTVIPKPIGALKLLDALCKENQIDIWWDDEAQKIKLKANVPPLGNASVKELSEGANIIGGSMRIKDMQSMRVSRVRTNYAKINLADDEKDSNFAVTDIYIDADQEDADTYNEAREEVVTSSLLTASNASNVTQAQQRRVSRFGNSPKELSFDLDAKDADLKTGDLADIASKYVQDADGSNKTLRYQIIYKNEVIPGHRYKYKALSFSFITRNAFIGADSLGVYTAESDANKLSSAFVAPDAGNFSSDGESPYLII